MTSSDHLAGPDLPLDDVDAAIMAGVRQYWDTVDPLPKWVLDQVEFAVDLDVIDIELARLVETHQLAGTRTDEQTRMITFQSARLSIMVTVGLDREGNIRIDGWLAPAATHRIELRTAAGSTHTDSDDNGRFSFATVPVGVAQLVVQLTGTSGNVVTPSINL